MENKQLSVDDAFQPPESPHHEVSNLADMEWVRLSNDDETVMAEANVSEVIEKEAGRRLVLDIDQSSMITASGIQQPEPTTDQGGNVWEIPNKIQDKLSSIEKRLDEIEKAVAEEIPEQDLDKRYNVDASTEEVRLLKNPNGQWTARDLSVGVTAQGETRSAALNNLDAVVAAVVGEEGETPSDEEIRDLGADPEVARSQDDELPDVLR